jgi:Hypothetical glycosyl hydrolase family 15
LALQARDHELIAGIKAVDPRIVVLAYKDLSVTDETPSSNGMNIGDLDNGVSYAEAQSHPDWFLGDKSGNRIRFDDFRHLWQMDVGNAGYQKRWIDNVQTSLKEHGFDGVIMDDALTLADEHHQGVVPSGYPTNKTFQDAYASMLAAVGESMHAAGLLTVANISNAFETPGVWGRYLTHLDAGFQEHFVNWTTTPGSGYVWDWGPNGWRAQVDEIVTAAAMGKWAAVKSGNLSRSQDPAGYFYGLGSYLLANDGNSLFGSADLGYQPEYDWNLGAPRGSYYAVPGATSVYRRDFTQGTVIVNASQGSTATINLGNDYRNESSNLVSSVTLGPQRATILRFAGAEESRPE